MPGEYLNGELQCTFHDIKAWRELGRYYLCKFKAALELVYFENTGDVRYNENAQMHLQNGLTAWKELSAVGSSHYLPFSMARVKHTFGWSYYVDEVEKDIALAKRIIKFEGQK